MDFTSLRFEPVCSGEQIALVARLAGIIWNECYSALLKPGQVDYMVDKFQSASAITEQIDLNAYEYYLIYAGGHAPVGYIGLQPKAGRLFLSKLYLLAAHRGNGYAKSAMAFAEETARARRCEAVWLTVNRHNSRAISVYRKAGFSLVREEVTDIGGGYVMDDFIFEKALR